MLWALVAIAGAGTAAGAESFRVGESVAFADKDGWHVGSVTAVAGGQVQVQAEMSGETQVGVFAATALRRPPWTTGARFWSDAGGNFKIKASVVDVKNGYLKLLKPDGSTISVPAAKLSDANQRVAESLAKAKHDYIAMMAAAAPKSDPEPEPMASANETASRITPSPDAAMAPAIASEPSLSPQTTIDLTQAPAKQLTFFKPGTSIMVGPEIMPMQPLQIAPTEIPNLEPQVLEYQGHRDENIDRLFYYGTDQVLLAVEAKVDRDRFDAIRWCSLSDRAVSAPWRLPSNERVVTVDRKSGRFMTQRTRHEQLPTVWRIYQPNETTQSVDLLFELGPGNGTALTGSPVPCFLPADRVLLPHPRGMFVVDLNTQQIELDVEMNLQGLQIRPPVISGDGRYFAAMLDRDVPMKRVIIDLTEGSVVHCSQLMGSSSGVFSPDGRHYIALVAPRLIWYDVQTWEVARVEHCVNQWGRVSRPFHILSDRYALDASSRLIDFELGMSFVTFENDALDTAGAPLTQLIGDTLLTASDRGETKRIATVPVPNPDVLQFLDSITSNPEFASLGEGPQVRLDVQNGAAHERITAAIVAMIEDIGWSVASNADLVFKAEYNNHVESQQFQAKYGIPKNPNDRGSYIFTLTSEKRTLWSTYPLGVIVWGDNLIYQGAVPSDKPNGEIPAGLQLPNKFRDAHTDGGLPTARYRPTSLLRGESTTKFDRQMSR
ncbi:MAG: SHD1 domain-containing protein [Rubripirellula sp.]